VSCREPFVAEDEEGKLLPGARGPSSLPAVAELTERELGLDQPCPVPPPRGGEAPDALECEQLKRAEGRCTR